MGWNQQRLATQVTQLPYSPDLAACDFWLLPKLKSPLEGRDFRPSMRFREIQWGSRWWFQQKILQSVLNSGRDAKRSVWGPKVPTLKGTEVSLSYMQCFLYLVSSSVNVSIFRITWLGTFWFSYSNFLKLSTWNFTLNFRKLLYLNCLLPPTYDKLSKDQGYDLFWPMACIA